MSRSHCNRVRYLCLPKTPKRAGGSVNSSVPNVRRASTFPSTLRHGNCGIDADGRDCCEGHAQDPEQSYSFLEQFFPTRNGDDPVLGSVPPAAGHLGPPSYPRRRESNPTPTTRRPQPPKDAAAPAAERPVKRGVVAAVLLRLPLLAGDRQAEGGLKLDAMPEEPTDVSFTQVCGRASEDGGELSTVEKVIVSGGRTEVAEHENFGDAVVQLSHEDLLVKEKGFARKWSTQRRRRASDAPKRNYLRETRHHSTAAASALFNSRETFCAADLAGDSQTTRVRSSA